MNFHQSIKESDRHVYAQFKLKFAGLGRKLYRAHSADGSRITYFVERFGITRVYSTLQGLQGHIIEIAN